MKKQKNIINGWLNIHKPVGVTSNHVIIWLKKTLSPEKIGHAGTLDPFAEGVLKIALGQGTKTVEYAMECKKTYQFTLKFGHETTTEDTEGTPTVTSDKVPTQQEILSILPSFLGEIEQVPPKFSALKIDGVRAYELARNDVEFEVKSRKVMIYNLKFLNQASFDSYNFEVECGKGTYIRSLGRDIARKLGSAGHLTALKRTKSGAFTSENAIKLENLEQALQLGKEYFISHLESVDALLDDIPVLHLDSFQAAQLKNGVKVVTTSPNLSLIRVYSGDKFIALGGVEENFIKPFKIIHL